MLVAIRRFIFRTFGPGWKVDFTNLFEHDRALLRAVRLVTVVPMAQIELICQWEEFADAGRFTQFEVCTSTRTREVRVQRDISKADFAHVLETIESLGGVSLGDYQGMAYDGNYHFLSWGSLAGRCHLDIDNPEYPDNKISHAENGSPRHVELIQTLQGLAACQPV